MEDYRGAFQNRRDLFVVANVGALQVDCGAEFVEVFLTAGEEVIEHNDFTRTFAQQAPHDGGADESRASSDDIFTH